MQAQRALIAPNFARGIEPEFVIVILTSKSETGGIRTPNVVWCGPGAKVVQEPHRGLSQANGSFLGPLASRRETARNSASCRNSQLLNKQLNSAP